MKFSDSIEDLRTCDVNVTNSSKCANPSMTSWKMMKQSNEVLKKNKWTVVSNPATECPNHPVYDQILKIYIDNHTNHKKKPVVFLTETNVQTDEVALPLIEPKSSPSLKNEEKGHIAINGSSDVNESKTNGGNNKSSIECREEIPNKTEYSIENQINREKRHIIMNRIKEIISRATVLIPASPKEYSYLDVEQRDSGIDLDAARSFGSVIKRCSPLRPLPHNFRRTSYSESSIKHIQKPTAISLPKINGGKRRSEYCENRLMKTPKILLPSISLKRM